MRKRILSILLTLTMIVSMTPLMAYADEPADTPIEPTAATEPAPTSGGEGNSEENLYTVTFDANDGSGEMEAETVESGGYTLPECKFTAPAEKIFAGWSISSLGGEVISGTINITTDITLYAIWEEHIHHEWSNNWSNDSNGHWHECTATYCDAKGESAGHSYENDACSTCSFALPKYDLWVGGVQVTDVNKDDIMGVSDDDGQTEKQTAKYDPATSTLTLNNFSYTEPVVDKEATIYAENTDLTIKLIGENTISNAVGRGIFTKDAELTIIGTSASDVLNVTVGELYWGTGAINVVGDGEISINNCKINVTSTYDETYGIYNLSRITITNAAVNATGTWAGIFAYGEININNSEVIATGTQIGHSAGLAATGNILITNNSIVTATGSTQGICSFSNVEINSSTVTAVGDEYGICGTAAIRGNSTVVAKYITDGEDNCAFYTAPDLSGRFDVYAGISKEAAETADPVVNPNDCAIYTNKYVKIIKPYNIYVGGVQFTSDNLVIDSTDGSNISGTATYICPPPGYINATLILDNFSYTGPGYNYSEDEWAAIYAKEGVLIIDLKGENTITADDNGIYVGGYDAYLEFYDYNEDSAVSSITVTARKSQDGVAIKTGSLDIKGGIIEASGNSTALIFEYDPHIYKPRYVYAGNDAPGKLAAEIDGRGFPDGTFTGKYVRITPVADPVEEPPYFHYIPVTPDDPLKPHRIEANEVISTEAAADNDQYADVADQIKVVTEDAEAKIAAAKTLEEIQAAEAAAKAEIEKIRLLYDVDETGLVARSKLTTLKSGKEAVLVKWYDKSGRDIDFEGYEIFRSTERYKGYGTKPFFETTREKYYNTAIEEGHTYYYRVRGYVTVDGERVYTELSTKAWRTIK